MRGDNGAGAYPIRVGHGARQVEEALLAALVAAADAGRREPALLALPVRVIVPSHSLRLHLAAALMRRTGCAIAGLTIQTLNGVALEIVERDAAVDPSGDALFPILVRRYAREEHALRERLDEFSDGYAAVADVVTDLLDAGFTRDHEAALIDLIEERSGTRELVARGCAIVRVAARTLTALAEQGVGHRSTLLAKARDALLRDPERALPARRVFVHGFAEATGLLAELLQELVRHRAAEVFFDEPHDPANPVENPEGWPFSRRLRERLAGVAGERSIEAPREPATLARFCAHGAEAEVRTVAERILALLETGIEPERIAVVARDLASYRTSLRRHFDRVGLPYSGVGERGSLGASRRCVQALLELLQRRGRTPADRWLDLDRYGDDPNERSDLRLALRHMGLVRLDDVAGQARSYDVRLPAVGGLREGDEESAARVERRVLPAATLQSAVRRAKGLTRALAALERSDRLGERLRLTRELLERDLGWTDAAADCGGVLARIDDLVAELPADFALDFDDFTTLLQRSLSDVGTQPIGGAGGGVQLLRVMDARARTFEAIFVLGMNRDVFPRTIRPDPLLPDSLRRAASEVLPDLPIKATGFDEERYLFAQLLSASPAVTLSWQQQTDAGRECAPSTLVERLAWAGVDAPAEVVPMLLSPRVEGCFTADERLTAAGLAAGANAWAITLPAALEDLEQRLPTAARGACVDAAAAAKLAALEALDPLRSRPDLLAPHFGFAGAVAIDDPRSAPPYVTTLESMARCPWQTFLAKLLRLEAPPDPLLALPGSDPRLVGSVVHGALDRIVAAALPESPRDLAQARDADATRVPWPEAAVVDESLHEAARRVLDDEGIALRGLETVLVLQARPFVERARALDWAPGREPFVLGSEMQGVVVRENVSGRPREVHFRADRVDIVDSARVLTDYKTGKPISDAKRSGTRGKAFLSSVLQGKQLQAVAYALAAGADGSGRYLFLGSDLESDAAEFRVSPRQPEFVEAFDAAVGTLFEAWDRGSFFPRLLDAKLDKENPACEYCEVAIACVRGDSGQRLRMERGVRAIVDADPDSLGQPLRALRELWRLQGLTAEAAPRELGE